MGNKSCSLSDRMKDFYENRSRFYLPRKVPVIIRLDGKAFHSFTKKMKKPYDEIFHKAMNNTAVYLCSNIQGCKMAYTQSDEISLLLTDYESPTTDAWFDYNLLKIVSVSASMATMAFNREFAKAVNEAYSLFTSESAEWWIGSKEEFDELFNNYFSKIETAVFDSRAFSIPKEEVCNYFIWRQQDATRNAIQMLGQTYFSHKELENINNDMVQDKLMTEKGINFNDMPTVFKRGVCVIKKEVECIDRLCGYKTAWFVDYDIPVFTRDRDYIESLL